MMPITVIKIGGSVGRIAGLPSLGRRLEKLGRQHPLLVVPGGGDFADTVRAYDRCYQLDDTTAHWMAILAMDQYGYLLAQEIPRAAIVRHPDEAWPVSLKGQVSVLLPFDLLHRLDPLPHCWEVTSDSIAAWLAATVQASQLILLKDVDGLYSSDPRQDTEARLLPTMSLDQLGDCGGVDPYLGTVLMDSHLKTWIVNGTRPQRLSELFSKGWTLGTRIQT